MLEKNKIHCMDCLEGMKQLEDNSVQLVIIDPPYYKIKKDEWDNQWKSFEEYLDWIEEVSLEIKRVLKDNGSFYIFGDDERIAHIQVRLDKHFTFLNHLVWYKPNNMPIKYAHNHRKFCPVSERILFYSVRKGKTGLQYIEEKYIKPKNPMGLYLSSEIKRSGKSRLEIAKLFLSKTGGLTGCVSNWINGDNFPLKEQYETMRDYLNESGEYKYLRKEYKYLRKEYEDLRKEYEDLRKEYEDLRRPFNFQKGIYEIISIPIITQKENTEHSTTKPQKLIDIFVKASSNRGDLVLDCFMGSGTTAKACKYSLRNFIGFEIDQKYIEIANKRLKQETLMEYFK